MWPALIGSLLTGVSAALMNNRQTQDANHQADANTNKQNEFTKMMSDTAHQREVADLNKAGLNPNLSIMGGAGAPATAGSAQPTIQAPPVSMPDMLAYGASMQQLELARDRLNFDKRVGEAGIVKGLTDQEKTKLDSTLIKQGKLGEIMGTEHTEKILNKSRETKQYMRELPENMRQYLDQKIKDVKTPTLPTQPTIKMKRKS